MIRRMVLGAIFSLAPIAAHSESSSLLAGQIWDVENARFVSTRELLDDLEKSKFILIGERHGRDAHQQREAFLIAGLADRGRYPTLALEMLTHSQNDLIEEYRANSPEYSMGLGLQLDWASSNWPSWTFYEPIFDIALVAKLKVAGADLNEAEQEMAMRPTKGQKSIQPSHDHYSEQMTKAHCGLVDQGRADALARLQIARDAQMAKTLLEQAEPEHGALLLVGSSHVRRSTGIPRHLPEGKVSVVALRETNETIEDFTTPFQTIVSGALDDFDFIWFTPKVEETSFCERIGKVDGD